MRCSEASLVDQQAGVAVTMFCRCWGCDICAPQNRKKLSKRIRDGRANTFITLSSNPHWYGSPEERAAKLKRAWRLARQRACRAFGLANFPFIAVFELTERGEPHLHIAARLPFAPHDLEGLERWLSNVMQELTGAPNVCVKAVSDLAGLARYMSKGPAKLAGCMRFWTSRGWVLEQVQKVRNFSAVIFRATLVRLERWFHAEGISSRRINQHRLEYSSP